ncbi:MAG: 5' nucleotidase, NT5C type [bacterium]
MTQKIIGIDIDGVITDEIHPNDNIWHNALCEFLGEDIERVKDSYYFNEAYNLSEEIINEFLNENIEDIYKKVKLWPDAKITINNLYDMNFNIILITARNNQFRSITENWLKKHGIKHTKLIHNENKAPLIKTNNIKLFIEDNAENAKVIAKTGIPVILLNKYHNQYLQTDDKITRVNHWNEINEIISKHYNINIGA